MSRVRRGFDSEFSKRELIHVQTILMFVFLLFVLCSCSSGNSGLEETREFGIDTVMIDTGGELLYLGEELNALGYSDLSSDKSKLYILDYENVRLITIDLLNHKLKSNIALDREGPNGVGDWISDLQVVNDTTLMVLGHNYFVFFKPDGKRLNKISMDHLFYMKEDLIGKSILAGYLFIDGRFYVSPKKISGLPSQLMVYNYEDDTYKLVENPYADLLKSSSLITRINKSTFSRIPPFYMKEFPSGLILTSTKLPQMLLFSDENSSISEVLAESKFYDKVEQVDEILEVEGDNASDEWRKEQSKRMHYLLPQWDENTNYLYRWAYKLASDRINYDNFLFVYDSSLNLVDEMQVTGIKMKPKRLLYIGSKIYVAANFEDELGFLVFDYTAPS